VHHTLIRETPRETLGYAKLHQPGKSDLEYLPPEQG